MKWWKKIKNKPAFIKLLNWEYWPSHMFYLPMWVYGPVLALKARHACFFTATNPGIIASGMGQESKYETILKTPLSFRPKTVFASQSEKTATILKKMEETGIHFPAIVKPDVGFRGLLVKKIQSEEELRTYLGKYPIDFIIQEFITGKEEFGVLYYRFPDSKSGHISSLTLKEFLYVTGDGNSSVYELILKKPRALLQFDRLKETHPKLLGIIPRKGERIPLGVIGNHSKGTTFINGNYLIDDQLIQTFDKIVDQLDGIHYGRFDLKCDSLEDLKAGKNITIIEINGVFGEPTHVYDPTKISYFGALKTIVQHFNILCQIGIANHKIGVSYMRISEVIKHLLRLRKYARQVKALQVIS
ncbi:MAG: hypothetical protein GY705_11675 [Bacteroidetes bacterium]|nr:hypothetical protein [Bacteroidota bacterium]